MSSLWPESFEASTEKPVKLVLEEQSKVLEKMTKNTVTTRVSELEALDSMMLQKPFDFAYRYDIRSKFIESYNFNVFFFTHDIALYPVNFYLDAGLAQEIGVPQSGVRFRQAIYDPNELDRFLATILQSQRIRKVVGALLRLSDERL